MLAFSLDSSAVLLRIPGLGWAIVLSPLPESWGTAKELRIRRDSAMLLFDGGREAELPHLDKSAIAILSALQDVEMLEIDKNILVKRYKVKVCFV